MLIAFDAAARTGSFSGAAKELHLTQSAVSRQIGALENQLDVRLFKRVRKTVQLTDTGKVYAHDIQEALKAIRNASLNAMTNPLSGVLNLAILPTFGTRWLMPRFPQFLLEHPDITVNFVTRLSPFDFQTENLHAAIHYGLPNWPDTDSTFLMSEEVVPVCSQSFLKEHPITEAQEVASLPLLHLSTRPQGWISWFEANGLVLDRNQGMLFEQYSTVAQAAVAGLGAALLPKFLFQSELDRGELVPLLDLGLHSQSGYYLVTPKEKSDHPPVAALRSWLLKTV